MRGVCALWLAGVLTLTAEVSCYEVLQPQTAPVTVNTAAAALGATQPAIVCRCSIVVGTSNETYDAGTIDMTDISLYADPTRDRNMCRQLRHHCRKLCRDSLDLNKRLPDENEKEVGYKLCSLHGMAPPGGWPVYSHAVLEGCRQHLAILPVKMSTNLCCGHTYINISDKNGGYNPIKAFGWNPDCKTDLYIL